MGEIISREKEKEASLQRDSIYYEGKSIYKENKTYIKPISVWFRLSIN